MTTSTRQLRKLMLGCGMEWRCNRCGISEWLGEPAPLHIDHINGNRQDNTKRNLQFLCPNCHALTDTYTGRNNRRYSTGNITVEAVTSAHARLRDEGIEVPYVVQILEAIGREARTPYIRMARQICADNKLRLKRTVDRTKPHGRTKIEWPADTALGDLLQCLPHTEVARMLGVSDNAIRKRCRTRGIQQPTERRTVRSFRQQEAERNGQPAPIRPIPPEILEDRRRKQFARLGALHGTPSGYSLERRLKLQTCAACRQANAAEVAIRRARANAEEAATTPDSSLSDDRDDNQILQSTPPNQGASAPNSQT